MTGTQTPLGQSRRAALPSCHWMATYRSSASAERALTRQPDHERALASKDRLRGTDRAVSRASRSVPADERDRVELSAVTSGRNLVLRPLVVRTQRASVRAR